MTGLDELIGRLEKATGADSALDYAIYLAAGGLPGRGDAGYPNGPTQSLDAAIALCERQELLVGGLSQATIDPKYRDVRRWSGSRWHATVVRDGQSLADDPTKVIWHAYAPSPALALCLAVCRALTAQKTGGG